MKVPKKKTLDETFIGLLVKRQAVSVHGFFVLVRAPPTALSDGFLELLSFSWLTVNKKGKRV